MSIVNIFEIIILLLFAHAIADFAFQSDSMAKGKNRHSFNPTIVPTGQKPCNCWFWWMSAHALVNGCLYYFFTGNLLIGVIETVAHFFIDIVKCENKTNPHIDQFLHLIMIVVYSIMGA